MLSRYSERLKDPTAPRAHKEAIEKYGVRFAGDAYFPHITLAKLQRKADFALLADLRGAPGMRAQASTLVLASIGYAGDLQRVLSRFPIK